MSRSKPTTTTTTQKIEYKKRLLYISPFGKLNYIVVPIVYKIILQYSPSIKIYRFGVTKLLKMIHL